MDPQSLNVSAESPLPGGIAAVVRYFFQVPQGLQIGGAVAGGVMALACLIMVWRRRSAIEQWLAGRDRGVKMAMLFGLSVLVVVTATGGKVSWDYMQHDNEFCTGCHVMETPFRRFEASEHDSLSCHDCHQQSIFASARQLYLWVAERPQEIGSHARMPDEVCESCHVTGEPEVWQRIASTAGHRTHLESDSAALVDVQCVTCHALEVHSFAPVDSTCGQADCHTDKQITLAGMADQTDAHCAVCHVFTREVPALATRDSAAATLTPNIEQCSACHRMQELIEGFDPRMDPHSATCGTCHNPHEQDDSADALKTCTTSGCHDDWRTEPFHIGPDHNPIAEQCNLCHAPHSARVDASDCVGCHRSIVEKEDAPPAVRDRLRPTLPFTTSSRDHNPSRPADRKAPASTHAEPYQSVVLERRLGKGDRPPAPPPAIEVYSPLPPRQIPHVAPPDSFEHRSHRQLACTRCHITSSGHGELTFPNPEGCPQCHHDSGVNAVCRDCHEMEEVVPVVVSLTVSVLGAAPAVHETVFVHSQHGNVECSDCHTEGIDLAVSGSVGNCESCHSDHHAADRSCSGCHTATGSDPDSIHAPPTDAHRKCSDCHDSPTIESLLPDRGFCSTCHAGYVDHYVEKECTSCHFQTSPAGFSRTLRRGEK